MKHWIWMVMSILLISGCVSTEKKKESIQDKPVGYELKGGKIVFIYRTTDYPQGFDEIEMVTVAGEFNAWDTAAKDWQAVKKSDTTWILEKKIEEVPAGSRFKFVVNTVDWQQPNPEWNKKYLDPDPYGSFNLIVLY